MNLANAFDPRIVRVGIEIDGDFTIFEGLDIRIQGEKYFGTTNNQAVIKISNLTRDQRHFILTKATPFHTQNNPDAMPINVTIDVGRQSYGTFRLFEGSVWAGAATQPPDIGVILQSLTNSAQASIINSLSLNSTTTLRNISQVIADKNQKTLIFLANDRQIANFSHTGSNAYLVNKLQMVGNVNVCIDNSALIVTDKNKPRANKGFVLSMKTGMVGIPQANQFGVTAQMLITPDIEIGDQISILSEINPSVNSQKLIVQQIKFDIANRDTPFFYTLLMTNNSAVVGDL